MDWTSDVDTHPPWLRFHLGITRWELYDRRDPILGQLTHYLATQQILGAGQRALPLPHISNLLFILRFVLSGWLHDGAVGDMYSGSPSQWCLFKFDHVDQTRLGAFKQISTPESEPEATLARLCQGSYLELQEYIFRSAQRMVDPGVSRDK